MRPLCCALDILQGQHIVGLGYLLPTISVVNSQLRSMCEDTSGPLTICKPLAKILLAAISKWFGCMFEDTNAQLAAVVHPMLKLYWANDVIKKASLTDLLKRRVQSVSTQSAQLQSAEGESAGKFDVVVRVGGLYIVSLYTVH